MALPLERVSKLNDPTTWELVMLAPWRAKISTRGALLSAPDGTSSKYVRDMPPTLIVCCVFGLGRVIAFPHPSDRPPAGTPPSVAPPPAVPPAAWPPIAPASGPIRPPDPVVAAPPPCPPVPGGEPE